MISPSRLASRLGPPDRRLDPPDLTRAETVDKADGRIETRRIAVRPIQSRLDRAWPAAARICRIERIRERRDRCERQVIYALTSLPAERQGGREPAGPRPRWASVRGILGRDGSGDAPQASEFRARRT